MLGFVLSGAQGDPCLLRSLGVLGINTCALEYALLIGQQLLNK